MIGVWYHEKSGCKYIVVGNGKMKSGGNWVRAVIYTNDSGIIFIRPVSEFIKKFYSSTQ